jgi:hypothetical protein
MATTAAVPVASIFNPQCDKDLTGVEVVQLKKKQIMVTMLVENTLNVEKFMVDPDIVMRDYCKDRAWPPKSTTIKICPPRKPGEPEVIPPAPPVIPLDVLASELEYFKQNPPSDHKINLVIDPEKTKRIRDKIHKLGFIQRLVCSHEVPSQKNWDSLTDKERFETTYALYVAYLEFAKDKKILEAELAVRKEKQLAFLATLTAKFDALSEDVRNLNKPLCDVIRPFLIKKHDDPEATIYDIRKEIIKVLKRESPIPKNPKLVQEIWDFPADIYDLRHVFAEDVAFLGLTHEDLEIFNIRTVDGEFHERHFWRITPNIDLTGEVAKLTGFTNNLIKAKVELTAVKTELGLSDTSCEVGFENCEEQIEFPDIFLTLENLKKRAVIERPAARYYCTPEHVIRLTENPTDLSDWLPSYASTMLAANLEQAGACVDSQGNIMDDPDVEKMEFVDGFYYVDSTPPPEGEKTPYLQQYFKQCGKWEKVDHTHKKYQIVREKPIEHASYADAEPYKLDIERYPIYVCGSMTNLAREPTIRQQLIHNVFIDMFLKRKDYIYKVKEGKTIEPVRIPEIVYRSN